MTADEIDELLADRNRLSVESTRLKLQLSMYQSTSAGVNRLANELAAERDRLAARVTELEAIAPKLRKHADEYDEAAKGESVGASCALSGHADGLREAAALLARHTEDQ